MVFVQEQYKYLVKDVAHRDEYFITQFANQEYSIQLAGSVYGQTCIVVGSLTAPEDQALQLLLLLHTLHASGATRLILFAPYLGYQRQDDKQVGLSCGLQWADAMIYAVGVHQIITLEQHSQQVLASCKVPIVSFSLEHIFHEEIAYFVELGFSFIFPDAGAVLRHRWLVDKFPHVLQGSFIKKRQHGMIEFENFLGKVGRKVIIFDDILDSGQTLIQICIALRHMGVDEIVIFVAHAFFHGSAWNDLWSLGVKVLYCTDSLPSAYNLRHIQIRQKSIRYFLQKII
jgi:ribose-phosphate pyrophosphokinase